jgi:selenocysteine lyase/cysteine desulfurase
VAEYFDALDAHHGGAHAQGRPERVRKLLHGAEQPLLQRLLDYLKARKDVRLLGSSVARERAPTVSFVPHKIPPAEVHLALGKQGIMSGAGHFYGVRLLEAMGVDPARGVVRLSFVHYTAPKEMAQLIEALDATLGRG